MAVQPFKNKIHQFLGIILAILSSLCFSLCLVIAKQLSDISPVQLTFFRFSGILLPSISLVIYKNENFIPDEHRTALFLRCFIGTTGLMLNFYAVQNMNLGDSSVILYCGTILSVAIFSKIFLNEDFGWFQIVNIVLTIVGIAFIVQPSFLFDNNQSTNIWGTLSCIVSALCGANVIVLLRILKRMDSSVIMSNSGVCAIIYTFLVLVFTKEFCAVCSIYDKILVLLLGAFSYFGQLLLTLSLKYEESNIISTCRSTTIFFSFICQIIFFSEIPKWNSIFGSFLIVLAVLLNAFKKYALTKTEPIFPRKILRLLQF